MKSRIRKSILLSLAGLLIIACSEILLLDITVTYPFDENKEAEEINIKIGDAINELDKVIQKQTESVVKNAAKSSPQFPSELKGATYSITHDKVGIADFFSMIDDKTVTKSITVSGEVNSQPITQTFSISVSVCDFIKQSRFETATTAKKNDDTDITLKSVLIIENIDSYCKLSEAEKKTASEAAKPYLYMEQENLPIVITLSEEKDLKDYFNQKDKIYSATINKLELKIEESPQNIGDIDIDVKLFVKSTDDTTNYYEFKDGKPDPEYYIGDLMNDNGFKIGSLLSLVYTFDGRYIIQKAIKDLDFEVGIKSFYKIKPGAGVPQGEFKLALKGEFFFSVKPLN